MFISQLYPLFQLLCVSRTLQLVFQTFYARLYRSYSVSTRDCAFQAYLFISFLVSVPIPLFIPLGLIPRVDICY
jgi:hypothetical protein